MKSSLSLSDPSEVDVLVEYISRIRCSVKVVKSYKINGATQTDSVEQTLEDRPENPEFDKMLKLGGLKL